MSGVNSDQGRLPVFTETAGILPINVRAAGKDHGAFGLGQCQWQMLPVHQVSTDGMAPTHVAPFFVKRIILVKQEVFALIEDQSVGIVHPIFLRGEMELWAEKFGVERLCLGANRGAKGKPEEHAATRTFGRLNKLAPKTRQVPSRFTPAQETKCVQQSATGA